MVHILKTHCEKCVGCRLCEMACSLQHSDGFNRVNSMIKSMTLLGEGDYFLATCLQCGEPACVEACPVEAIKKDRNTGMVTIDKEECTGCGQCSDVCLFGIVFSEFEEKAFKCDHCGGNPECAAFCPTGALEYAEVEKVDTKGIQERYNKLQGAFQWLNTLQGDKMARFVSAARDLG
jgi:carbon-monoxide dehydrogenase iron sulfur subunit